MALPVFDSEDAVPEPMRPFYAKTAEGKWAVKPEEVPDVTKLTTTIERERELKTTEKARADKAEADLVELRKKQRGKDSGISEEELTRLRDEDAAARKPLETKVGELTDKLRNVTLTDRVRLLGVEAGWMKDRVKQAMVLIKPFVGLAEGSDEAIVVLDENGKPTTMPIDQFLAGKFKTENLFLYQGSGSKGSGATGSTADGESTTPPASDATLAKKRDAVHSAL